MNHNEWLNLQNEKWLNNFKSDEEKIKVLEFELNDEDDELLLSDESRNWMIKKLEELKK